MKINWMRIIPAGILATLALDLGGLFMTGKWWDIPTLLGAKLGTGLAGGLALHYGIGVILAAVFVGMAPSLWGPLWVRAMTYMSAQTVVGVWLFMFPLLGAGVAGLGAGPLMPVISLARHLLFGLALAAALKETAPAAASAPLVTAAAGEARG